MIDSKVTYGDAKGLIENGQILPSPIGEGLLPKGLPRFVIFSAFPPDNEKPGVRQPARKLTVGGKLEEGRFLAIDSGKPGPPPPPPPPPPCTEVQETPDTLCTVLTAWMMALHPLLNNALHHFI